MMRIFGITAAAALFAITMGALAARAAEDGPGKQAFDRVCKVCHGEEGRGGAGPALLPFDRELEDVIAIVRDGTGQMPPIAAERVSDDELAAIVRYLKSLTAPVASRVPPRR